jgi:hypothetical protein
MNQNTTQTPRVQLRRYACDRCRDKGWVMAPYYSDFRPCVREACCPDCGGPRVVLATRQEVIEFVLVFAAIIGLVALGGGQ